MSVDGIIRDGRNGECSVHFEVLAKKFLAHQDRTHGSGASEEDLGAAENELRLSIGGGFREFVKRFGWASGGAIEIYGLGPDVPHHLNLVELTLSERNEMHPRLPPALLPVMNDGGGNLFCLDTSRHDSGEHPVVFWDHELSAEQLPEFVSSSFAEWFFAELSETPSGSSQR